MSARRDALAHAFIANTLEVTREWPPALQVRLHELAFSSIPELILQLDAEDACAWVRRWREEIETPAPPLAEADAALIASLADEWRQTHAPATAEPATGDQLRRLAELLERFGPLALAIDWRTPRARA